MNMDTNMDMDTNMGPMDSVVPTVPINTNYIEPYDIVNFMTSPRTMCYKNWLKTPVRDMNEDWTFDNGNDYTHLHFIRDFYNDLLKVIQDSGYDIDDEKEFKRDVALFVYRLSSEPK